MMTMRMMTRRKGGCEIDVLEGLGMGGQKRPVLHLSGQKRPALHLWGPVRHDEEE